MRFVNHPLWQMGFRPFFTLAFLAGMTLPILWALMLSGVLAPPTKGVSASQWHAHEMFFGFGWAVLGGFLLTSTKTWVKIRGFHGYTLILLATAWLVERIGMWFAGNLPALLFGITSNFFIATVTALLLWTLLRHRKNDSYRTDNIFFLFMLPAFVIAKNLLLSEAYFAIGYSMTLGLFRMAFLIMLERTLTQFMKNVFQLEILRHALLDRAIKLLALGFVFERLLPRGLTASIALLLALLLLLRLFFWKPHLALRRLDIGIMYLGYLAIIAQLLIEFVGALIPIIWIGSVSVHVFTFGVMGLIIPAMLIRISNGHTGRKVVFDGRDKLALWIMMLAFVLRVVLPQFYSILYPRWIELSAVCWFVCFSLLAWRYIPFLMQARVDGKPS